MQFERTPMISSTEFGQRTGLTYREVDHWTRRGVLKPTHERKGSGTQRGWSELEVRVGIVVSSLRRCGMRLDVLRVVAEQMREWSEDEWSGHAFVDADGGVHREPRSMAWWLDLDIVANDLVSA